jgi:trans-aconitate methyltransferase
MVDSITNTCQAPALAYGQRTSPRIHLSKPSTNSPSSDIADKFPSASVTGTDLSPIQSGQQPSNCTFEIDDCCSPWVYPPSSFDFIHIRGLFGSIADWPALYRQCYEHIQPGGYIEQVEWSIHNRSADGTLAPNATLAQWSRNALDVARGTGKTFEIAENMAGLITEAGFVDVVEKRFKWPIGPWSGDPKLKELGEYADERIEIGRFSSLML